ncbi:NADH/Ubiquinone/plastoquinone (complex I) [Palaeococcus pacificus DY20341]|uniref:NADH/Ubiquinone/plastoquinone (Complex I) n=1 Tax=Palaeococcus pacificus DY20341 TaxID=1343739 RepID=A0A075LRX1_9EURY|nr:proton-conducting transporter membrane subunit [Palaeococcus pacificus]AIF68682.1 NADH/Ubiquinone/plastoquinone (complex I) [Palaeococcus pacificus DY20341]
MIEHLPALMIAVPLFGAFITPLFKKRYSLASIWAMIITGVTVVLSLLLVQHVVSNGLMVYVFGADKPTLVLPSGYKVPVRIIFEVDAIGAFMALSATLMAFIGALYSYSHVSNENGLEKYYTLLLLLEVGILGMVLTGDLFNLFVFLEIAGIAGSALVGFRNYRGEASEAGIKYLIVSAIASLMVLFSIGILYGQYGNLNLAYLSRQISFNTLDMIALGLLFASFAMKCGSVPMHYWVPDAYTEVPAGINPPLLVATYASLYALFRVSFTLFGNITWDLARVGWIMSILGVLTMFIGVTMALVQKDVKRLMSYHAISQTGYMLLGVGVGLTVLHDPKALAEFGRDAMAGGIFHIINHIIYKSLLLMTAGALFYVTGTRNLNEMGGLARKMPITTIAFIVGAAAISGIPPFNGFASKFLIYETSYQLNPLLAVFAMVTSILTLASFVKVFASAFLGPPLEKFENAKEVPKPMVVAMIILAALCILFGLFPTYILDKLVYPAVDALLKLAQYQAWGGLA